MAEVNVNKTLNKKLARRTKQRADNLMRAKEMHAANLIAKKSMLPLTSYKIPKFNIGCSGWFYWHWRGIFYPENSQPNHWFNHYLKYFKTVELNAPFYSWPKVVTVKNWLRAVKQQEFIYTVKVSELITHIKKFTGTKQLINDFGFISNLLGEHMGCFLFQLPPSFSYTPQRLTKILNQLDNSKRNVIEFRHDSWWNKKVYKAFEKENTIFCATSAPSLPTDLIQTSEDIYIRFHGLKKMYQDNYSKKELIAWADDIQKSGAKHTWCYFNNDRGGYAIKNATMLLKLLKNR